MSRIQRNITIVLVFILIITFSLLVGYSLNSVSRLSRGKIREYGDFLYDYGRGNKVEVQIVGLTKAGLKKEVLHMPKSIDNRVVSFVSTNYNWRGYQKAAVKRVYVHGLTSNVEKILSRAKTLEAVIFLNPHMYYNQNIRRGYLINPGLNNSFFYTDAATMTRDHYYEYGGRPRVRFANLVYDYNYPTTEEYYFIDAYFDTIITYKPKDPVRDGYNFAGWYKEKECINPWDFKNDKVLSKVEGSKNETKKTFLYAKWTK